MIELRWVGRPGQYVNGLPARDLTGADIVEVERREGITRERILASGLYVVAESVEVAPFCGAELTDGGRCRELVGNWGERCAAHAGAHCVDSSDRGAPGLRDVEGIGATYEQRLADAGIETLGALAELTETELARLAQLETLGPGMTVTRLETWRAEARELMRQELPQ